ncbi:hypothetical protein QNH47_16040 [Virgibacillus halodenitrificans]|jgi:hypothetical protein|uniref:hypothetical protein n=1 Tax=Virgibacillus halodenitrificans TaxID=1482 RepID=UPI0024BFE2F3|nr:hypothetical protein [Virgibacillus halodenitrificans]WHX25625.1 hypothetical protein QNH47_16040 [Virgibacillus halodenitrificans]
MYKDTKKAIKINLWIGGITLLFFVILSMATDQWGFFFWALWSVFLVFMISLSQIRKHEKANNPKPPPG